VLPYAEILCDTVWHRVYPPLRDKIITKCTRQSPQTGCGYLLWHPSIRSSPCTDTSEGKTGENFTRNVGMTNKECSRGSTWLNSTFMMEGFERQEAKTLHLFSSYLRNALYKPLFSHFFCCRIPRLQDSADMPRFRNLMCELNPMRRFAMLEKSAQDVDFSLRYWMECPVLWPHLEVPIQYNASVPPCIVQYVVVIKAPTAPEHQRLEQSLKRHYMTLPKEHSAQMRSDQTKPCIVLQSFLRIFLEIEETMIEVQRSFLSRICRFDCESCPTLLELDTYEEPCHAVPIAFRF